MTRHLDWEARLRTYLETVRTRAFEWGKHDCCLFAAGAGEAMTGIDHMAEFRGRYRSAAGAIRALRTIGQGTLAATMDARLPPIAPALAQRGDAVMAPDANGFDSLGICIGRVALFVGAEGRPDGSREGLVTMPRDHWSNAWAVR